MCGVSSFVKKKIGMDATQTMNLADEEYVTDVISQKHPPFMTELNWSSSESVKPEEYDMKTAEDQKHLLDETQVYSAYSSPEDDDVQGNSFHFASTQIYDVLEGEDAVNLKKEIHTATQAFEESENEELDKAFIGATINTNLVHCLDQQSENAEERISPSPKKNCLSMDQGKVLVSFMPTTTVPLSRKISEEETGSTKLYLTKNPTETNDLKQDTKVELLREEENFLTDKYETSCVSISNPNVKTNQSSLQLTKVTGCKVSVGQQKNDFHVGHEMPDKENPICIKESKNDFSISDNFNCNNLKDNRQLSATDVFDCLTGVGLAISLKKKDEALQHTLGYCRRESLRKPKVSKSAAQKSKITKDMKKQDKNMITSVDGTSDDSNNISRSKIVFIRRSNRIQTQVSNSRNEKVKKQSEKEENRRSTSCKNVLIKKQSVPQAKGMEIGRHRVLNAPKYKIEIIKPYKKKNTRKIEKCQGDHVKSGKFKKEVSKDVYRIKKNTKFEEFERNLTRELSTQDSKCQKQMGFDNEEVTASRQETRQQRKSIKRKLDIPEDKPVSLAKRLRRSNLVNTLNSNKDVLHINEEIVLDGQNCLPGLTSESHEKNEAGFQNSPCQRREQRILGVKLIGCKGAKTKLQIDRKTKDVHKKRKDCKEKKRRDFQLRHKTDLMKPKVAFTGVTDESGQKIVKELGGEVDQNITDCTHLVTDKIRRTVKFLAGLAKGITIVRPEWLQSCRSAGFFVDCRRFHLNDSKMEMRYKFSLETSLNKARKTPVFLGYKIHVTRSVHPEPLQMKEILWCAGAKYLSQVPTRAAEKTLVISCEEDKVFWKPASKAGIPVVSAEFVLTGILKQEVNIEQYLI